MSVVDLLERPLYTMTQANDLLQLKPGTAARWIDGYARGSKTYPPVVREVHTGESIVTWGEFVETRLLAEYRNAGVPLANLRPTVHALRAEYGRYPLAQRAPFLEPHGRELVQRIQDRAHLADDLRLIVVRNGQLVLSDEVQGFVNCAQYDDNRVVALLPDAQIPQVSMNPLRASGEPAVRAVPTEVIAEQVRAGDAPELIADLYDLPLESVLAAVRFEGLLAA